MLVLAHRGANRVAPENTIAAFAAALEQGADGVELDVHRSSDGHLVVRHDAGTPAGVLCDLPLAVIRRELPDVSTLSEALDACRGSLVNVEVKNAPTDPDWDPSRRAAELLVETLRARAGRDDVLVSSFDSGMLSRLRVLDAGVRTAMLAWARDPSVVVADAAAHGCRAVHPDRSTVAATGPEELAAAAHGRGLTVNVWTVNDADEIAWFAASGIDGIVSDDPALALRVLGR